MPYWFDGNNLIGKSAAALRADPGTRRAFLQHLAGFHRERGGQFLVFFDGDDPDRAVPPKGVQVRYSAPESTDSAILHRLQNSRIPAEVIIVTNDHQLRILCKDAGARVMNWAEFESAVRKNPHSRLHNPSTEPVNVDEWIRYFGLDKDSLE